MHILAFLLGWLTLPGERGGELGSMVVYVLMGEAVTCAFHPDNTVAALLVIVFHCIHCMLTGQCSVV